jgi:serine/threonine-protein kinase
MEITPDQLVHNLSNSGLMTADEAVSLCECLSTLRGPTESATVVQELVGTGKLTAYQAECVCRGETSGLVFDEYVVLDKIGQGGMGVLLKAQHRRMNRIVAVKKLRTDALESEDAVKRFYREVEAAARLTHSPSTPNQFKDFNSLAVVQCWQRGRGTAWCG